MSGNDQVEVVARVVDVTVRMDDGSSHTATRYMYKSRFTGDNNTDAPGVWGWGKTVEDSVADLYVGLEMHRDEEQAWDDTGRRYDDEPPW